MIRRIKREAVTSKFNIARSRLLLLDEPLSSFDADLRANPLRELAALQETLNVTKLTTAGTEAPRGRRTQAPTVYRSVVFSLTSLVSRWFTICPGVRRFDVVTMSEGQMGRMERPRFQARGQRERDRLDE
jgi:hypothetical protein